MGGRPATIEISAPASGVLPASATAAQASEHEDEVNHGAMLAQGQVHDEHHEEDEDEDEDEMDEDEDPDEMDDDDVLDAILGDDDEDGDLDSEGDEDGNSSEVDGEDENGLDDHDGEDGDSLDDEEADLSQDDQQAAFQEDLEQVFALQPNIEIHEDHGDSESSEGDEEGNPDHAPMNDSLEIVEDGESDGGGSSSSDQGFAESIAFFTYNSPSTKRRG
jgi:hypothetical protein